MESNLFYYSGTSTGGTINIPNVSSTNRQPTNLEGHIVRLVGGVYVETRINIYQSIDMLATEVRIDSEGKRYITRIKYDFMEKERLDANTLFIAIKKMFDSDLTCEEVIEAIKDAVDDPLIRKVQDIFDKLKLEVIQNGN